MLRLEQLEERDVPVVHPFTPAALVSPSPNAGGTPANQIVADNLGGIPAPIAASNGHAQGVPFDLGEVPARAKFK